MLFFPGIRRYVPCGLASFWKPYALIYGSFMLNGTGWDFFWAEGPVLAGVVSTMNISLPDALKSFAVKQVDQGSYGTSGEYVREVIRPI